MTIFFALVIALASQSAGDGESRIWGAARESSRLLGGCIIDYTRRLESSGEAADIVVEAAMAECVAERNLARRALNMAAMIEAGMNEARAAESADAGVAQWDADYRRMAVREVVRIRAARNGN